MNGMTWLWPALALAWIPLLGPAVEQTRSEPPAQASQAADSYDEIYRAYRPVGWRVADAESMKISTETNFFTLNLLSESDRAYALVSAARERERERQFAEAMEIYQKVIDEYPDSLYRVSDWGVFVPIAHYCQLRILNFPPDALRAYRMKHDARAKEAYEMAVRKNSLEGLADVRDRMLATSFGAPALNALGYSALDRGHYLEALEYFETAWRHFPEVRVRNPHLATAMALCRKMLGQNVVTGEQAGLVGHWKMDEGRGDKIADASGLGHDGTARPAPNWAQGKIGGAYRFDRTNTVSMPAQNSMVVGVGETNFSVSLWVYPDDAKRGELFAKRGRSANEALLLSVDGQGRINYAIATRGPHLETGHTRGTLEAGRWVHIGLVKVGGEVRVFLDGKLDLRETLKERVLANTGGIVLGSDFNGRMDDVRLYARTLSNREMAEMAGAAGKATMKVSATSGEAPLVVDFSADGETDEYFWEFGDGETATGPQARHVFGRGGDYTVALTVTAADGRISVAHQNIGVRWRPEDAAFAREMNRMLDAHRYEKPEAMQLASAPNLSADDYMLMPPTTDPLGLTPPVWSVTLPGSRLDSVVYSQPVVTERSVLFRHKNIVYSYSLLSGQLRWKNDLGGRVTWQNWQELQFAQEDILVQDGLVFTPIFKVGPTLVALDEVTGQMQWAHGPMVATTTEEARMRFETAPAGGPRAVFAGYVLDNIEGMTHTDTEYGVIAFESTTGRVLWRREICRLRPGKFAAGFAVKRRNRIRSFLSPPLYKEGTVYYCTNAGAIAALDALSGRIKWVMRYPYYENIHDSTQPFAKDGGAAGYSQFPVYAPSPMLWYNQRPLLIGDDLYVLPVNAPSMFKLDRRTGKALWQKEKGEGIDARRADGGWTYFLGPTADGHLVMAYSSRQRGIHLIDANTGETTWMLGDWVKTNDHPFLAIHETEGLGADYSYTSQRWPQMITARPFISSDGKINFMSLFSQGWPHHGWEYNLAVVDLNARRIVDQRRYISGEFIRQAEWSLENAPAYLQRLDAIPHKNARVMLTITNLKAILERGTVPHNEHGPFLPFSRVTAERFGTTFEARMGARALGLVYDRGKVDAALAGRNDVDAVFARAELAVADGRLKEAARLIQQSMAMIPAEDVDFRAMLNQQLYPIHKELARASVRAGDLNAYLGHCIGMSQTVGSLADEMESLLALSEAYERRGDWRTAARMAQKLASGFGQYEYSTASLLRGDLARPKETGARILDQVAALTGNHLYARELSAVSALMKKELGLYFGALSPLSKDLKLRAGELAANRLIELQHKHPELKQTLDREAATELAGQSADEQVARLWEFAGAETARKLIDQLVSATDKDLKQDGLGLEAAARLRKRQWELTDAARICGVALPEEVKARWQAPRAMPPATPVGGAMRNRSTALEEDRGPAWLALEREDSQQIDPDRLFLGGRVRKRFDNKFLLYCFDLQTGQIAWRAQEQRGERWFDEIRLAGAGDEPGFTQAFVHGDVVVVNGLYDVLAFNLTDGKLKWRYQTPFGFEIRHAIMSGDLLTLAGESETLTLYLGTADPRGEVVWQEKEEGVLYGAPFFCEDRLIGLRKMPFNLTVRYRSTGKMIGRLELPDLLLLDDNPLIENGPRELPFARDGSRIVVSDGRYYILLDAERMRVVWKRLIDANDPTRLPPLRFALNGDYLAVVKQDFDRKAIYMLSSQTGEILWQTDPKVAGSPQPIDSMLIRDGRLYGIKPHAGQGFYFTGMDCRTGKMLFQPNEQVGYGGKPETRLRRTIYGDAIVAQIKDRQDFELKAFSTKDGKLLHKISVQATGDFGEHGRASATVQNGKLALLGKTKLVTTE